MIIKEIGRGKKNIHTLHSFPGYLHSYPHIETASPGCSEPNRHSRPLWWLRQPTTWRPGWRWTSFLRPSQRCRPRYWRGWSPPWWRKWEPECPVRNHRWNEAPPRKVGGFLNPNPLGKRKQTLIWCRTIIQPLAKFQSVLLHGRPVLKF